MKSTMRPTIHRDGLTFISGDTHLVVQRGKGLVDMRGWVRPRTVNRPTTIEGLSIVVDSWLSENDNPACPHDMCEQPEWAHDVNSPVWTVVLTCSLCGATTTVDLGDITARKWLPE